MLNRKRISMLTVLQVPSLAFYRPEHNEKGGPYEIEI